MSEPTQSEKTVSDTDLHSSAEERTPSALSGSPEPGGPSGTVVVDNDATVGATTITAGIGLEEMPGDFIGRYKLLEKIGEGGFGLVYVAEQMEPVKRRVALKVIKLGMDTRQVVARFEAERQTLALMDHPNIAKVLDAGATDSGRPYFVMEFVQGTKITEYCDRNKLSTRKRLDLFMLVCRAVEHAHQKGIIHRDIKPSNILVTMNDGAAVPKVIDFGIAKATAGNSADKAVYTQYDQFIGTPAYMSPEQAEAGGLDIDTRSDIYSLGVLLYELLTGETPLESKNLLARGFDEMRRLIREWEPQRPSIRLDKQKADEQTTVAKRHGTDAPKLIRMVRGDLDWVVMKCLEKDRSRRYDTAAQLTAEIQRFLANEPVMARPPSNLYRFQKLVRRNRLAFAAGSAVLVSLIIALCITSWFVIKEKEERDLAEKASRNSDKARKIAEDALAQAEAARQQSDVDLKHTEAARQQSDADRARAGAAEKRAAQAQTDAENARHQAETALRQATEDRDRANVAEKKAADAQTEAQLAKQQADTAENRAISEAARRVEAAKAADSERALREQAQTAQKQAEAARQQAEAAATAALAQVGQSRETISNFLASLDSLPPAEAIKVAGVFFTTNDDKQPWAPRLLRQLGGWRARQGDWPKAVAAFSKAEELDPADLRPYDALAPLLAQNGDTNAFAQNAAHLLAKFGGTKDPAVARVVAEDTLFSPLPGLDAGGLVALARLAAQAGTNEYPVCESQLTLGLAEYRLGHFTTARDWTVKALADSGTNFGCEAEACAASAMTQQQLMQTNGARILLARDKQIVDTKLPKVEGGDIGAGWQQWIMAQALLKEATALIEPPAPAK
jgi:serine/threonine protein kinase